MLAKIAQGIWSITVKLGAWIIVLLGASVTAYLAWVCLAGSLWRWANNAWWHWLVALIAYPQLFLAPILTVAMAMPLIAAARTHLWWEAISYIAGLGTIVSILWAFSPIPQLSLHWPWWSWGIFIIFSAILTAGGRMFSVVHPVDAQNARRAYSVERKFNHHGTDLPPKLGIAMSGGGIRSAAFNLGVLQALHDNKLLREVDIMSAVSGGSYAMSWFLLQPFYTARLAEREHADFKVENTIDEMFQPDGRFQRHLAQKPYVMKWSHAGTSAVIDATLGQLPRMLAAATADVEEFNEGGGVRWLYRKRIQELFQGLPSSDLTDEIVNQAEPANHSFSCVTPVSYRELGEFVLKNRLPYFVFNGTVLVRRAYRHMLWPTTFEWTACDIGSDVCGYRTWEELKHWETEPVVTDMSFHQMLRYFETTDTVLPYHRWALMVNLAPAISGAAVGLSYFSAEKSSRETRLKTWTPFVGNMDLGYLLYRDFWNEKDKGALYVSDGGHSENLGAYALIKRQCQKIIIVDAEHEPTIPYVFEAYKKLKRQLAEEMHLAFTVCDIDAYLKLAGGPSKPTGPAPAVMKGDVVSTDSTVNVTPMSVIYIKLGLDRTQLDSYFQNVSNYAKENSQFPQDPTSNQSFTTEQFVAYRDLGRHVASEIGQLIHPTAS